MHPNKKPCSTHPLEAKWFIALSTSDSVVAATSGHHLMRLRMLPHCHIPLGLFTGRDALRVSLQLRMPDTGVQEQCCSMRQGCTCRAHFFSQAQLQTYFPRALHMLQQECVLTAYHLNAFDHPAPVLCSSGKSVSSFHLSMTFGCQACWRYKTRQLVRFADLEGGHASCW